MGCHESKLEKDPDIGGVVDIRIQPVLSSEPKGRRTNKHHKTGRSNNCNSGNHSRTRNGSGSRTPDHRKRSPRSVLATDPPKNTIYDPRITAKYAVKAVIGKGTFSRVVRVEHRTSKQPYAIKMIEAQEGREVFEAELSVLRRVNHPNVIRLIEVFESGHKIYMVMELATGGNLLDRIESHGCFTESDAARVLQMVLSGVGYLHSLGITHRDLKPDNLLYYHPGADSRIMITDFGFASTRRPDGNVFMHTVCGTPQYLAPEIVARRPYTCSVDMWAVGVIAFILLAGSFPFDAEQDAVLLKLILKGKVSMEDEVWNDVSSDAKDFVRELLQRDPTKRPSASQALVHPWTQNSGSTENKYPNQKRTGSSSSGRCSASQRSSRSAWSVKSGRSVQSLRSGQRRVQARHIEALHKDPEVAGLVTS